MSSRKAWLIAKVASEGYCCIHGYLRLCKARDETPKAMAENIGMSPDTIWYHYRNPPACQKQMTCMAPIIQIIENEKKEA